MNSSYYSDLLGSLSKLKIVFLIPVILGIFTQPATLEIELYDAENESNFCITDKPVISKVAEQTGFQYKSKDPSISYSKFNNNGNQSNAIIADYSFQNASLELVRTSDISIINCTFKNCPFQLYDCYNSHIIKCLFSQFIEVGVEIRPLLNYFDVHDIL
ncbi:MAG: hypothetical protein ACFFCQ_14080, partial [Promethearchaeota archaeon]